MIIELLFSLLISFVLLIRGWLYYNIKKNNKLKFYQYINELFLFNLDILFSSCDLRLLMSYSASSEKMHYYLSNTLTIIVYMFLIGKCIAYLVPC